jgi:hypothetical protein
MVVMETTLTFHYQLPHPVFRVTSSEQYKSIQTAAGCVLVEHINWEEF